jgi:hypothetical protein
VGHTIVATTSPNETEWTAVYWEWPVDTGSGVRYERVILNVTGPSHQGQLSTFLSGFARSIVAGTAARSLLGSGIG